MPCNKKMTTWVPKGYDYKEVTVRCGNTRPDGDPYLCDACKELHRDTNWRAEAEANGERY